MGWAYTSLQVITFNHKHTDKKHVQVNGEAEAVFLEGIIKVGYADI